MIMASTYKNGLANFYVNTAQDFSLLAATIFGIVVSTMATIGVSLCTIASNWTDEKEKGEMEWAKTTNIDNPLSAFRLVYEEELAEIESGSIITSLIMDKVFRKARFVAIEGGALSIMFSLVKLPAIPLNFDSLTFEQFSSWLKTFQIYCFVCTFALVVVPPFEEGYQMWARYKQSKATRRKKKWKPNSTEQYHIKKKIYCVEHLMDFH
ncbi:hypothetical protein DPMN_117315 [Dreissena polymorpha]|uniref:Uncharacterized protein n=1 Tax=Dreissena polymorpha TaxID=45954 RepID=A0A9D4KQP0_DREPO|nr:hypothetical protein DPMN_117315 [Dreissena polymorpha]